MRLELVIVAVALGLAAPARAQWTTVCVRYTARIRTCSATYVAPPVLPRQTVTPATRSASAPVAERLDEQDIVLGVWRATGVVSEAARRDSLRSEWPLRDVERHRAVMAGPP